MDSTAMFTLFALFAGASALGLRVDTNEVTVAQTQAAPESLGCWDNCAAGSQRLWSAWSFSGRTCDGQTCNYDRCKAMAAAAGSTYFGMEDNSHCWVYAGRDKVPDLPSSYGGQKCAGKCGNACPENGAGCFAHIYKFASGSASSSTDSSAGFELLGTGGHGVSSSGKRPAHCYKLGTAAGEAEDDPVHLDCKNLCLADSACAGYEVGQGNVACQLLYLGVLNPTCPTGFSAAGDSAEEDLTKMHIYQASSTTWKCYKKVQTQAQVSLGCPGSMALLSTGGCMDKVETVCQRGVHTSVDNVKATCEAKGSGYYLCSLDEYQTAYIDDKASSLGLTLNKKYQFTYPSDTTKQYDCINKGVCSRGQRLGNCQGGTEPMTRDAGTGNFECVWYSNEINSRCGAGSRDEMSFRCCKSSSAATVTTTTTTTTAAPAAAEASCPDAMATLSSGNCIDKEPRLPDLETCTGAFGFESETNARAFCQSLEGSHLCSVDEYAEAYDLGRGGMEALGMTSIYESHANRVSGFRFNAALTNTNAGCTSFYHYDQELYGGATGHHVIIGMYDQHGSPNYQIHECHRPFCGNDRYYRCCKNATELQAPAAAPTAASTAASAAKGDPHLMNMKGEAFDVMQTGNMMLLEIPRGSSPALLDLALHADIEHLGVVSCGPTFITSASITGRWIGVPLEIRSGHIAKEGRPQPKHTFAIRFDGKAWFPHAEMQRTMELSKDATLTARDRMFLFQVRGLDIAVSQPKRPRIFLDIQVKGLGKLKAEIGGLLGIDDHSSVEELPSGCEMSDSSLSLIAAKADENLQWSARALL